MSVWHDDDEEFDRAVQREIERRLRLKAAQSTSPSPDTSVTVAASPSVAQPVTNAIQQVPADLPADLPQRSRRELLRTEDSNDSLFVTDDEAEDDHEQPGLTAMNGTPTNSLATGSEQASTSGDMIEPERVADAPSSPEAPLAQSRRTSQADLAVAHSSTTMVPRQAAVKSNIVPKLKTKNVTSITVRESVPVSASPVSASSQSAVSNTTKADTPTSRDNLQTGPALLNRIPKRPGAAKVAGIKRKSVDEHSGRPAVKRETSSTTPPPSAAMSIEDLPLPDWYREQRVGNGYDRAILSKLLNIKEYIRNFTRATGNKTDLQGTAAAVQIRDWLHDFEHQRGITGELIKKARMLEVQNLPKLFHNHAPNMPYDIIADAKALYRKWCRQDFDADPLRGIKYGPKSKAASLDEDYPSRLDFRFYGTGDLVSGQWWPNMIMTMRDGAHGASQGGISGRKGEGAYSVIVAGAYKDDKDEGDTIYYCGTEDKTKNSSMTDDTKLLFDNIRTGKSVRVIRSGGKKENKSVYKPSSGYRYDGVYDVVESELLDQRTAHHRFKLVRQPGQDPIRYKGDFARPSSQDEETYREVRKLLQGKGE